MSEKREAIPCEELRVLLQRYNALHQRAQADMTKADALLFANLNLAVELAALLDEAGAL